MSPYIATEKYKAARKYLMAKTIFDEHKLWDVLRKSRVSS